MLHDVAIVGAGAAGLATAIFTRRLRPQLSVVLLEGAKRPGAKILVSGGSRCNVTNTIVTEADFWGGPRTIVRRVLRALPVEETVAFFRDLGVPLHEEAGGKLFPDSNRSRDVVEALLRESAAAGVDLRAGTRVLDVARGGAAFELATSHGPVRARAVVLATGGRSLPKSGSDGAGYGFAERLGHSMVPTTPALDPLVVDSGFGHRTLSGISHEAELAISVDGSTARRLRGALLWTHFGLSGPVALNASRHWLRAALEGRSATVSVSFCPREPFDEVDRLLLERARERPRASMHTIVGAMIPGALAGWLLERLEITARAPLSQQPRDARRRVVHGLTGLAVPVIGSRGYDFAEVTAGGIALDEIDPGTMESRVCRGLYLVGEILDVDGRIGGFNFQWAWASARQAARALASR